MDVKEKMEFFDEWVMGDLDFCDNILDWELFSTTTHDVPAFTGINAFLNSMVREQCKIS